MKKKALRIFVTAIMVCTLAMPVVAEATIIPDNPAGSEIVIINIGETMGTNYGKISYANNGIIRKNQGEVLNSCNLIKDNSGIVKWNINQGTIEVNYDTVENNNWAKVIRNHGNIYVNTGTLNRLGIIETNYGYVDRNENHGTVNDNYYTIFENQGMVINNIGTIEINCSNGTVENNTGTICNNSGKVINNKGTVINNGGTVENSISGGQGVNPGIEVRIEGIGKENLTISAATDGFILMPKTGYHFTAAPVIGTIDTVAITPTSDGSYTISDINASTTITVNIEKDVILDNSPATGDDPQIMLWMCAALIIIAGAGFTATRTLYGRG